MHRGGSERARDHAVGMGTYRHHTPVTKKLHAIVHRRQRQLPGTPRAKQSGRRWPTAHEQWRPYIRCRLPSTLLGWKNCAGEEGPNFCLR
jgi:hypothetical protein